MQDCPAYMSECPCAPAEKAVEHSLAPTYLGRAIRLLAEQAKVGHESSLLLEEAAASLNPITSHWSSAGKHNASACCSLLGVSSCLSPADPFDTTSWALSQIPE